MTWREGSLIVLVGLMLALDDWRSGACVVGAYLAGRYLFL